MGLFGVGMTADTELTFQQAREDASAAELYESWNVAAALVHRIQRERSATCAWVASRIATPSLDFRTAHVKSSNSLVIDFRKRTNACIAGGRHRITPAASMKLREVRELADPAGSVRTGSERSENLSGWPAREQARMFCLVFSKYTELISEMLDEAVFRKDDRCARKHSTLVVNHHRRPRQRQCTHPPRGQPSSLGLVSHSPHVQLRLSLPALCSIAAFSRRSRP